MCTTVKHLDLASTSIWHYLQIKQNMRPQNTVSNSVTPQVINGHTPLVCWYRYHQHQRTVCFNIEENMSYKGLLLKERICSLSFKSSAHENRN